MENSSPGTQMDFSRCNQTRLPGDYIVSERVMENTFSGASVTIQDCRIIELSKISDPRGNLTFIEGGEHVPFDIQRVYYLYDVPGGSERGGHAHKNLQQLIIAMSGSFDVVLDDGFEKKRIHLNRSYYGLYVTTMVWRELDNFSSGSVSMVLASKQVCRGRLYS